MSWATCYSGSNNIHFNYPPLMSDGRNYTNWIPGAEVNKELRNHYGISSNWKYRQFLQHNSPSIMRYNEYLVCNESNCTRSYPNNKCSSNSPYLFSSVDDNKPMPYGYENSDLKNLYLSREQLQSKLMAPEIMTKDL